MITSSLTIKCVREARGARPGQWLVLDGAEIVGLLEKYRDTRTDRHPWKAFVAPGTNCKYLGAFYPEEGGRDAAIDAVASALGIS